MANVFEAPHLPILAIDPGLRESAYVLLGDNHELMAFGKHDNREVRKWFPYSSSNLIAVELMGGIGRGVDNDTFITQLWAGRFIQQFMDIADSATLRANVLHVPRSQVKTHLLGVARGNDAMVRTALINKWGGKEKAIGRKGSEGKLHGLSKDMWSALAIAVTVKENMQWVRESLTSKQFGPHEGLLKLPCLSEVSAQAAKPAAQ